MWQEIAVCLIGALVIAYIGKKIYTALAHPSASSCAGCTGCPLKGKCKADPPEAVGE